MSLLLTLAAANPVDHVTDKPLIGWYVSNYTVMMILAGCLTAWVMISASKAIVTGDRSTIDGYRSQGLLANLVESVCLYLRNDVFKPVLEDQTDTYTPMLWTFFWFILICNLLGLVPLLDITAAFIPGAWWHGIGGTATQSIWVTGALAAVAFFYWNGIALAKDPIGYLKHLTAGAPWFMWPIMVPVEIMGMFVKPVALALRLFANMTGGHIILAVLLSFIKALALDLGGAGWGLAIIPLLGAVAINILEILVAFIQAYIFTFLTCLFLGQLVVHEHEHEEHDEHEGDEAHEHLPHATPQGVDQARQLPNTA